ncbi:MAG: redoxin domain-containing protein [Planctomycetaceae bacterium]|nr:redoxin domain-containing protein [Planctomycetales bacterium]MCB9939814.1 redoxin domain-containing protein [Planctomycetaceae bacterium]
MHAEDSGSPLGRTVAAFSLSDYRGREFSLDDFSSQKLMAVAFLGTECPLAKLYGPRLNALADEFASKGVAFVGINSNTHDSNSEIAAYVQRHAIEFPLLKDLGNRVADAMGAQRTPEVFLLDQDRVVRYWGRIDDQYGVGYSRDEPTRHDLRLAIEELLSGLSVSQPITEAVGCHIGRIKTPDETAVVTYSNQVARIFQRQCVECHRPGEIAPFSLTNYDEVVGWADTISEVIEEQRMPPWHAKGPPGHFKNERLMTDDEKQTIYDWVASGAPQGDPKQLPEPIEYVTGWRLSREPDAIIAMRDHPFVVPAEGTVEYQYFIVDPGFTEDKWIRGAEVLPGNRSVVHHAIVFFRTPDEMSHQGLGSLTGYVPGQSSFELPSHQARFVPAGSKFVFQMHYTPTGAPEEDLTRVGLLFSDAADVTEELVTLVAINHDFEIPAHAQDFPIQATRSNFPPGAKLQGITPHMHVRGRSFRVDAINSTATNPSHTLLDVPRYDFNWQHAYALTEPLPLTSGLRLECTALFDNSEKNLVNPDPSVTVRWGDQTWEEMMIAFLEVSIPVDRDRDDRRNEPPPLTDQQRASAEQTAADLIKRFDRDGDGVLRNAETPKAFATFAFGRIDKNRDKTITYEEALEASLRSVQDKANGNGS